MTNVDFRKSLLVAAHPDDEILWFSSVVEEIDHLIFCYQKTPKNLLQTRGRQTIVHNYPRAGVETLGVPESSTHKEKHFKFPIKRPYGLLPFSAPRWLAYKANYQFLVERLKTVVPNYRTVFTHNPWGEYGHEEHVQVYRVLKALQQDYKFTLFFDNYVSGKSMALAKDYLFRQQFPFFERKTNEAFYTRMKGLYQQHKCWTWVADWSLFEREAFLKDDLAKIPLGKYGKLPPLNIIRHW